MFKALNTNQTSLFVKGDAPIFRGNHTFKAISTVKPIMKAANNDYMNSQAKYT